MDSLFVRTDSCNREIKRALFFPATAVGAGEIVLSLVITTHTVQPVHPRPCRRLTPSQLPGLRHNLYIFH
jgi:hypothetical protein